MSPSTRKIVSSVLALLVAGVAYIARGTHDKADQGLPTTQVSNPPVANVPVANVQRPNPTLPINEPKRVPLQKPAQWNGGLIEVSTLPNEAKEVLSLIQSGGPFRYSRDGIDFQNRERILPSQSRGYYKEYTVPTPGERDRGARRIISGEAGEKYYTDDHYDSFRLIQ
jgi:guanyl-specific ribonuclease Sa